MPATVGHCRKIAVIITGGVSADLLARRVPLCVGVYWATVGVRHSGVCMSWHCAEVCALLSVWSVLRVGLPLYSLALLTATVHDEA